MDIPTSRQLIFKHMWLEINVSYLNVKLIIDLSNMRECFIRSGWRNAKKWKLRIGMGMWSGLRMFGGLGEITKNGQVEFGDELEKTLPNGACAFTLLKEYDKSPHEWHLPSEIDHEGVFQWSQDVSIANNDGHYSSDGTNCDEVDPH